MSLISSTSSVGRMFHSFLKRKIGPWKLQQKIFFLDLQVNPGKPVNPEGLIVSKPVGQGRITYRFSYAMRHNDANKMIPHPLSYASIPRLPNKIDIFLKPVLNILILTNLIVGCGKGVIKEGVDILH